MTKAATKAKKFKTVVIVQVKATNERLLVRKEPHSERAMEKADGTVAVDKFDCGFKEMCCAWE
jgi:hypothetical protein